MKGIEVPASDVNEGDRLVQVNRTTVTVWDVQHDDEGRIRFRCGPNSMTGWLAPDRTMTIIRKRP